MWRPLRVSGTIQSRAKRPPALPLLPPAGPGRLSSAPTQSHCLPAFREPHSARTWLGRCGGHTHAPLPSPPPSRAAELAARRAPFPSLGSSDVPVSRKATFALKKKKNDFGSFNWPKLRPSDVSPVDSSIGFDYPVITHMAPNKELRFFFFFSFPGLLARLPPQTRPPTGLKTFLGRPPPAAGRHQQHRP
uniref:Uncharacterized protein n=1 Tax=Anas zonorhyncha TaxID=75864 RepID=A0A8B9U7H2_9AVES